MNHFALKTHATKDEPKKGRDGHTQKVENAQTGPDDSVGVGEIGGVAFVFEKVVDCAADEDHRGVDPEGSVAA